MRISAFVLSIATSQKEYGAETEVWPSSINTSHFQIKSPPSNISLVVVPVDDPSFHLLSTSRTTPQSSILLRRTRPTTMYLAAVDSYHLGPQVVRLRSFWVGRSNSLSLTKVPSRSHGQYIDASLSMLL